MREDLEALLRDVEAGTARLLDTVRAFDDGDLAAPSRCPGWTRGHVVAHVARNADALVRLVTWAASGVETPMYPSPEVRAADIEAGASRPVAAQVADLEASAAAFSEALRALPAERFSARVRIGTHEVPAAEILPAREREVEVHHVDLDAGYAPQDWPPGFAGRALPFLLERVTAAPGDAAFVVAIAGRDDVTVGRPGGPRVSGDIADVVAWLFGRGDRGRLRVAPDGPVPHPPPWSS